ncbi:MAG: hypothetical protein ACOX6I_08825 [Syntrophomonadaceae bacterium]
MKTFVRYVFLAVLLLIILATAAGAYLHEKFADKQVLSGDTDLNGQQENYILSNYQLQAVENNHLIWESPKDWQVKQAKLADADNDGRTELVMVVWKKGSFGKSRPWWVKETDDRQLTCHLFMYRLTAGRMKAVWCSSALEHPIRQAAIIDVNHDGLNELRVQEIPGYGPVSRFKAWSSDSYTSLWAWNGWGFERIME